MNGHSKTESNYGVSLMCAVDDDDDDDNTFLVKICHLWLTF
jgi:hypothetical protein